MPFAKKSEIDWKTNYDKYKIIKDKGLLIVCPRCNKAANLRRDFRRFKGLMVCHYCNLEFLKPNVRKKGQKGSLFPKRKKRKVSDEEIIDREKLLTMLKNYAYDKQLLDRFDIRNMALVAVLFLTGCRISEIIGVKDKKTKQYIVEPLKFNQIRKIKDSSNRWILKINTLPVLKKKLGRRVNLEGREVLQYPTRDVGLPLEAEDEFVKILDKYLDVISRTHQNPDEVPLFPISQPYAWMIINKNFNDLFCHYFRHVRATDLGRFYGMTSFPIKRFFEWSNSQVADRYQHITDSDITDNMFKQLEKQKNTV